MNTLLEAVPQRGTPVIYIQNVFTNAFIRGLLGGVNAPGAPGTEMDHQLIRVPGAPTFQKDRADAFSNPELDDYLRKLQVDHLVIVGLDAAYCVNATAEGARNRGYRVTLPINAVATESGTPISKLAARWRKAGMEVVDVFIP